MIALTLPHRFVDRDMLMRYHFGLGVGHIYSRHSAAGGSDHSPGDSTQECDLGECDNEPLHEGNEPCGIANETVHSGQEESSSDSDGGTDDDEDSQEDPIDDEELYATEEMYWL